MKIIVLQSARARHHAGLLTEWKEQADRAAAASSNSQQTSGDSGASAETDTCHSVQVSLRQFRPIQMAYYPHCFPSSFC